jgi:hypothetical protein
MGSKAGIVKRVIRLLKCGNGVYHLYFEYRACILRFFRADDCSKTALELLRFPLRLQKICGSSIGGAETAKIFHEVKLSFH